KGTYGGLLPDLGLDFLQDKPFHRWCLLKKFENVKTDPFMRFLSQKAVSNLAIKTVDLVLLPPYAWFNSGHRCRRLHWIPPCR
ncbi:MAG: hypothetical protein ACKOYP_15380, partial [Bacteroidota bacterium]